MILFSIFALEATISSRLRFFEAFLGQHVRIVLHYYITITFAQNDRVVATLLVSPVLVIAKTDRLERFTPALLLFTGLGINSLRQHSRRTRTVMERSY